MNPLFSGMGGLDPSKLTPQTIAALTDLMRTLTPDQMMKMQSLMHNSMAGFDVTQEMIQFESSLPPNFRERMAKIMYMANGIDVSSGTPGGTAASPAPIQNAVQPTEAPTNMNEARLVILRSVAGGLMSPEEALKVLFTE